MKYPYYARALKIASSAHADQERRGDGEPYAIHTFRVAESLRSLGCSDEVLAAACLHDVLEDTSCTREFLERYFPGEVIGVVEELTKTEDMTRDEYLKSFQHASIEACVVKAADRIDNFSSPSLGTDFDEYYARDTQKLYETFVKRKRSDDEGLEGVFTKLIQEFEFYLVMVGPQE